MDEMQLFAFALYVVNTTVPTSLFRELAIKRQLANDHVKQLAESTKKSKIKTKTKTKQSQRRSET